MRLSLLAALAVVVPLAVVGCTSASSPAPDNATHPTAAAPKQPTGTQLKALLAPASFFPAGFTPVATADSRDQVQTQTTPAPPNPDCTLLGGTGWFAVTGLNTGKNSVSFAQAAYLNNANQTEQDQQVFAYSGNGAATQLDAVGKLATLCPHYSDAATHSTVKVTEHAIGGLGDGAYTIRLTDSAWKTGSTLQAIRVGNADLFVYSTSGADNGATDATKLSTYLVHKLQALR